MKKTEELFAISPDWIWMLGEGMAAIAFYLLYYYEASPLPGHFVWHYQTLSIASLILMLLSCSHYAVRDDALIIKFLGIKIRTIFWFEISHALLAYKVGRRDEGMIFITIFPCRQSEDNPNKIKLRMLVHPTKILLLRVPKKQEDTCIEVFRNHCKTFSVYQKEKSF